MGVADRIRRTQLHLDQQSRKRDMEELMRMVEENRLHEADERQMETLRLSLELNRMLNKGQADSTSALSPEQIAQAVESAVSSALKNLPAAGIISSPSQDPARPSMRHTSLSDIQAADSGLEISGELAGESTVADDASSKLEKLKKLKGNG